MTTQTEAERLADALQAEFAEHRDEYKAAAELRRLVSFNQQLMDEVARLNKAVADEREACALMCETEAANPSCLWEEPGCWAHAAENCAAAIRARRNT